MVEGKSFAALMKDVVTPGLCTVCGTCVAVCPYNVLVVREESFRRLELRELEVTQEIHKSIEELCERCGFCYNNCPEIMFDLRKAERKEFGTAARSELGHFLEACKAQATDEKILSNAQSGGVATALLEYLLDNGLIDAAVTVTTAEQPAWKPMPTVIVDPKHLWQAQKTKYTPAATVIAAKSALYEWGRSRIAVVATPCQVRGIHTANISPKGYTRISQSTELIVGLFCYGTYSYNDLFMKFLAKKHCVNLENISKIDLDTEKLRVYINNEVGLEIHRHQLHRYLRESCRRCHDFTNRLADISLGGVGSPKKWTTVIIRTERARRVFDDAVKQGHIRKETLSNGALEEIKRLAKLKFDEGARD
ncbi:MAG: Coenzyme F420 hydrogenase/dehydrogenase, beta subunit C-terminal domain [Candidatus Bathyarchaeota archaeon]|nr:Coenzyme F420 hydrogenase/dehydrogenase, beta subunit C-terminal domain [Candidatus Bathyarchaeota archaeon]